MEQIDHPNMSLATGGMDKCQDRDDRLSPLMMLKQNIINQVIFKKIRVNFLQTKL